MRNLKECHRIDVGALNDVLSDESRPLAHIGTARQKGYVSTKGLSLGVHKQSQAQGCPSDAFYHFV